MSATHFTTMSQATWRRSAPRHGVRPAAGTHGSCPVSRPATVPLTTSAPLPACSLTVEVRCREGCSEARRSDGPAGERAERAPGEPGDERRGRAERGLTQPRKERRAAVEERGGETEQEKGDRRYGDAARDAQRHRQQADGQQRHEGTERKQRK